MENTRCELEQGNKLIKSVKTPAMRPINRFSWSLGGIIPAEMKTDRAEVASIDKVAAHLKFKL